MLPVFLIIVTVATLVLVVLVLALIRHIKILAASVREFSEELKPALQDLRGASERTQLRLARTAEKAQELREPGPARRGRRR